MDERSEPKQAVEYAGPLTSALPALPAVPPPVPPALRVARWVVLALLAALIIVSVWFFFFTPNGQVLMHHPRTMGKDAQQWVWAHRIIAPLVVIGIYLLLSIVALPVWWLQMIAGYAFGLLWGIGLCQIGATIGATATFLLARWLAADWFRYKVEAKMARLRALDEKMGHNGLLVVMGVRLMHFVPFGVSNYAFGLTKITAADVAIGTALGGIPATTAYVILGYNRQLLRDWHYVAMLVAINVMLLVPLALRYMFPQWFQKIGVE
jgi:uncharacterized membrane protein YdjX (TVP38/TMEM64 family)